MATRLTIRTELRQRLGDAGAAIWTDGELNGAIDYAIKGLYPHFYRLKVGKTTAGGGPLQTAPSGARNVYSLGLQRTGSTRVRPLRGWRPGDGEAFVPKTGIDGDSLVWCWTTGYDAPTTDGETLLIPVEAEEVVILRSHVSALEALLSDRLRTDKYHALHVRASISEDDIATTIDALHASLRERLQNVTPLPEVQT